MNAPARSLVATMAQRYEMDPVQFAKTVRATAMPSKHTDEQFAAFMMVANTYGLNPVLREVYAFPTKQGGIASVVSIDGWIHLVNAHPDANGFQFSFEDDDKSGMPVSVTCTMWRKSREQPVVVTEYFKENYRNTEPWNVMPRRMLRHKAFKEAARYAFGLAGIHDEDEARDMDHAVEAIEHEIPPTDLDQFAAGNVDLESSGVPSSPDDGGTSPGDPAAAGAENAAPLPAAPAAQPFRDIGTQSLRAEAIDRFLRLAADKSASVAERLQEIDALAPAFDDRLDEFTLTQIVRTAIDVAENRIKPAEARRHLESL